MLSETLENTSLNKQLRPINVTVLFIKHNESNHSCKMNRQESVSNISPKLELFRETVNPVMKTSKIIEDIISPCFAPLATLKDRENA